MQSRHTLRLLTPLSPAVTLLCLAITSPSPALSANPASVAIESVGIARETGCAVVHVATSQPTQVRVNRPRGSSRVVADFLDAVLAPDAARAVQRTPHLSRAVTIRQASSQPPVVRLEVVSAAGYAPAVERFADSRGLLVRLLVDGPPSGGPWVARPTPSLGSDATVAQVLMVKAAPMVPLIAPMGDLASRTLTPASLPVGSWRTGGVLRDLAVRTPVPVSKLYSPLAAAPGDLAFGGEGGLPAVALRVPTTDEAPEPAAGRTRTATLPADPQPRPTDAAEYAELQRVRVVGLDPLRVAIDCSRPLAYRMEQLDSPLRYVVTFPGATIGSECLQAVALHPAHAGTVQVQQAMDGAQVVIPAPEGQLCSPKPGASPNTVLCELAPPQQRTLVAQRPAPAEPGEGDDAQEPPDVEKFLINVDFENAPVVEILTALARYADRNIITTPSVTGAMSVHLSRVTLTEALDLIAALNSFEYTLVGERNYVIGTAEEIARVRGVGVAGLPLDLVYKPDNTTPYRIAQELREVIDQIGVTIKIVEDAQSVVFMNLPDEKTGEWLRERAAQVDVPPTDTTRWVQLEYLTASQAASALKGLTPNVEVHVPGPEAPQVAVLGLAGKSVDVDRAEQLLAAIDVEPTVPLQPDGPLVTDAVLVSYADPDGVVQLINDILGEQVTPYVASTAADLKAVQGSEQSGGISPAARIVLRGSESAVAAAKELVAEVDVAPPQVQITATITDVNVDKDQKVGFEWDLPGLIVSEESTAGDGFKFGKIMRAPFSSGGAGTFTASFDAMIQESNATILSRTKLVAVNGKSASFLVGEIVPYEVAVAAEGTVTRSVEFQEIGLGLKFGPSVDAEDKITMFLSPQVRSFSGFSPQGYPIVATREAQTIVRVSDGDVVAIGGLLRDEELKTLSGIPLLKDIPLFGSLFKKRQTQRKKSEVVVFAEVRLLRPGAAPEGGESLGVEEG